jgi:hypothetical protein
LTGLLLISQRGIDVASQNAEDLKTLYKAIFIELPTGAAKKGLGVAKENQLEQTAWKGYDAWVRLIGAATGKLYSNPLFGDLVERSLGGVLRVQRVSNSVSGALFTALWVTVGLPTAAEVQSLRAELGGLRRELRLLTAGPPVPGEEVLSEMEKRVVRKRKRAAA